MSTLSSILSAIPDTFRIPLLAEYNSIVQNYLERRWTDAGVHGGRFSEIVYWILQGRATGSYAAALSKPSNMVDFCRALESNVNEPRSFRILIPRMLPALYEIRNNRDVGHVGGDVDSNHMDSLAVVSMCGWIMGELIRVFHNVSVDEAQGIVDFITDRKIPLVWESGTTKRILKPNLPLIDQIVLLVGSQSNPTSKENLISWLQINTSDQRKYLTRLLRKLNDEALVHVSDNDQNIELLPPGVKRLEELVAKSSTA